MKKKNIFVGYLLTILFLPGSLQLIDAAEKGEQIIIAPLNPYFILYKHNEKQEYDVPQNGEFYGERPSPVDRSHMVGPDQPGVIDLSYPTSFDLRSTGKLTAIRNQGACGSCWAFATMAGIESYGKPTNTWNFSEQDLNENHGYDFAACAGGNHDMATAYMARWAGPLSESDVPYPYGDGLANGEIVQDGFNPQKHIQQVIYLPNRSGPIDNDTIKYFMTTYGAVYISYYHSSTYMDATDENY